MAIGQKVSKSSEPGPDKGWAWVVACACFFINFIMAGLARSSGVMYVALLENYGASREEATTPFSVRVSVRNMTGPLVGILGQKYGIRPVTICGAVLAAIGGIMCFFAPNIFWITIFWGLIHGFGFGLSTVLHMITINQYFDKFKATAFGFGYSGDCIGTFILPIVLETLLFNYGVCGTFLVVGGIVLHVIPLAMLLRPPSWLKTSPKAKNNSVKLDAKDGKTMSVNAHCYDNEAFVTLEKSTESDVGEVKNGKISLHAGENIDIVPSYEEAIGSFPSSQRVILSPNETVSHIDVCLPRKNTETEPNDYIENANDSTENKITIPEFLVIEEERPMRTSSVCMDGYLPPPEIINSCCKAAVLDDSTRKSDNVTEIIVENINQIRSMTATITEQSSDGRETIIRIRASSETVKDGKHLDLNKSLISGGSLSLSRGYKQKGADNAQLKLTSIQTETRIAKDLEIPIEEKGMKSCIKICYDKDDESNHSPQIQLGHIQTVIPDKGKLAENTMPCEDTLQTLETNSSNIFKTAMKANLKPMFILISLTMAAYVLLFISVMTVIIDFGQDKAVPAEIGKYLVIVFSGGDLIGRLGFGVAIDRRLIEMHHYAAGTVTLMGLSVALIPFGNGMWILSAGMAFYGFIQGGVAIMYPILIGKYMEKDEEAISMGCLNFYGGVLMLAISPMIGYFRDIIGSYDDMFYIVGLVTVIAGLAWLFEPVIFRLQKKLMDRWKIRVNISCEKTEKICT